MSEEEKKPMKIYLCGPIQYVEDYITWRSRMDDFLDEHGHEAVMPWGEVYHGKKIKMKFKRLRVDLERDKYFDEVRKYMKENIVKYDLDALISSDAVLFWHPRDVKTAGSFGEITLAHYLREWTGRKYQIWVVSDYHKDELSYWVIGCSDKVFKTMEDFEDWFLKKYDLNNKEKKEDKKER